MIYGTPNLHVVRDVTDLIGIRTLLLRQYWQGSGSGAYPVGKPSAPASPANMGLMGEQTLKDRGRMSTIWTYQGIGAESYLKTRGNSIDYEFTPGFSQVPIQMHKNFMSLLKKYQGRPGNDGTTVLWPPTLSGNGGGAVNSLTNNSDGGDANPMYGIQSFFEMDGVYRYRYASRKLDGDLMNGVGSIVSGLPGKAPSIKGQRDWLKAPPSYAFKAVVYDITEYYWLSRRGGWPRPVYGGSGT